MKQLLQALNAASVRNNIKPGKSIKPVHMNKKLLQLERTWDVETARQINLILSLHFCCFSRYILQKCHGALFLINYYYRIFIILYNKILCWLNLLLHLNRIPVLLTYRIKILHSFMNAGNVVFGPSEVAAEKNDNVIFFLTSATYRNWNWNMLSLLSLLLDRCRCHLIDFADSAVNY